MVLAHPPSLKLLYPRSPETTYTMSSGLPPVCIIFSVILNRSTSLPFWHSLLSWPFALFLLLRFLLLHLRQSKFKSFEFRISAGSSFTSEFCIVCSIMNSPFSSSSSIVWCYKCQVVSWTQLLHSTFTLGTFSVTSLSITAHIFNDSPLFTRSRLTLRPHFCFWVFKPWFPGTRPHCGFGVVLMISMHWSWLPAQDPTSWIMNKSIAPSLCLCIQNIIQCLSLLWVFHGLTHMTLSIPYISLDTRTHTHHISFNWPENPLFTQRCVLAHVKHAYMCTCIYIYSYIDHDDLMHQASKRLRSFGE